MSVSKPLRPRWRAEDPKPASYQPQEAGFQDAPAFFNVPDLKNRWRLSERQVRRILASGALTQTRFGSAVRVAVGEVLRYEAACSESRFGMAGQDRNSK
jgi:hypothetical protein